MKFSGTILSAAFLAACVVGAPTAHAAVSCNWVTTDLPLAPGVRYSGLQTGSDNGEWLLADGWHPWLKDGSFTWHNGALEGPFRSGGSRLRDVNNSGVLLGNDDTSPYRIEHGVVTRLEPVPGEPRPWAEQINNLGDVTGIAGHMGLYGPVVVWPAGSTTPRELPGTRNGLVRFVRGIDDGGNVIALEYGPEGQVISRVWNRDGVMTVLETLPEHYSAYVEFIRDGRIFGTSEPRGGTRAAVEWGLDGKIVRTYPELYQPLDVNASGHVLGATLASGPNLVWRAPGQVDALPAVYGTVLADNGDVYGTEYDANNVGRPRQVRCG